MEARFRTADGDRIYRTGLTEIVNGENEIFLSYSSDAAREALAGEGETLEGAEVEVVKPEGGQSIEEQDNLVNQWQEDPEAFQDEHGRDE